MKEISFKTQKTARVYFSNEITNKTKEVVIACHGYAQLGKYFIKKFDPISTEERCVVVPEALSKFYWNGMNGRVVASWMTKEDRESEIEDYIEYLNQVYSMILEMNSKVKIIAFGFSQGASTISRWMAQDNPALVCEKLILWSGSFPMDVIENDVFKIIPFDYLFGNKDQYYSKKRVTELEQTLNSHGVHPNFIEFDGEHKIYESDLQNLFVDRQ